MIVPKIKIYTPSCVKQELVSSVQIENIENYLMRVCHAHLNCLAHSEFTLSELIGGFNKDLNGTPLQDIYDKYYEIYNSERLAFTKTARDCGWFLIRALDKDEKTFVCEYRFEKGKKVRTYRLLSV